MQLKYALAWCSLSASSNTYPPGQPSWKLLRSVGRRGGHFASAQGKLLSGSLSRICPSASGDAAEDAPRLLFFYFLRSLCRETGVGGYSQGFRWLGGRGASGWLFPLLQELGSCTPLTSRQCDATFSFLRSQYLKVSVGIAPEISTSLEIALLKLSVSLG